MRIIILISGKAGVGKSTFAGFLKEHLMVDGWSAVRVSFAAMIKELADIYYHWDYNKDEKGRKLLQSLGNTGREYNENLWADWVVSWIDTEAFEDSGKETEFIIIDDWRYRNEFDVLSERKDFKVITVRLESMTGSIKDFRLANDISETSLPEGVSELYDYIIYNHSTLKDLFSIAGVTSDDILDDYRDLFKLEEC